MKNKLLAQICKIIVVNNIIITPVVTWRFLVGPINERLSIFVGFIGHFDAVMIFLCFMEIIVFRFLLLFGWKHFNSTNEDFMSVFVNVCNILFAFVTQISRWILGNCFTFIMINLILKIKYIWYNHWYRIIWEYRSWTFDWQNISPPEQSTILDSIFVFYFEHFFYWLPCINP